MIGAGLSVLGVAGLMFGLRGRLLGPGSAGSAAATGATASTVSGSASDSASASAADADATTIGACEMWRSMITGAGVGGRVTRKPASPIIPNATTPSIRYSGIGGGAEVVRPRTGVGGITSGAAVSSLKRGARACGRSACITPPSARTSMRPEPSVGCGADAGRFATASGAARRRRGRHRARAGWRARTTPSFHRGRPSCGPRLEPPGRRSTRRTGCTAGSRTRPRRTRSGHHGDRIRGS
ncbi:hypothetical protein [Nannocystis pusilla]|uniref:hypothetical protein n=1 Tax=Nannocystis pusilla TaxID=889268 RepID=UPI003B79D92B